MIDKEEQEYERHRSSVSDASQISWRAIWVLYGLCKDRKAQTSGVHILQHAVSRNDAAGVGYAKRSAFVLVVGAAVGAAVVDAGHVKALDDALILLSEN